MRKDIGERLQQVRKELGWALRKMAKEADVSLSTWQRLESGDNAPSGETLLKFADLGLDPTWILTGRGNMRRIEAKAASLLDAELLGRVTEVICKVYNEENICILPIDLGRLAAQKYNEIYVASTDQDEQQAMLKLMIVQLRIKINQSIKASGHEEIMN